MTIRAHRFVAAGALAIAAFATPIASAFVSASPAQSDATGGKCLATVTTNGSDPQCVGTSFGVPFAGGTPWHNSYGQGHGISSGQVLPGQTWSSPAG